MCEWSVHVFHNHILHSSLGPKSARAEGFHDFCQYLIVNNTTPKIRA
jgi:hypothetical protein